MTIDPDQRRKWRELADKHVASAELYDPIDESHLVKFARAVPALLDALDEAEREREEAKRLATEARGLVTRAGIIIGERDSLRAELKLATSGDGAYQHRSEHSRLLASDVAQGKRIAELIAERDSLRAQLAGAYDTNHGLRLRLGAVTEEIATYIENMPDTLPGLGLMWRGLADQIRNGAWRKGGGE